VNKLSGSRVLIIGANGFIGKHLLMKFSEDDVNCNTFARTNYPVDKINYSGDITDKSAVEQAILECNPEFIFHLAGNKGHNLEIESFYESIQVNLIGSLNVFNAASKLNALKNIIIMGSAQEYGHNLHPYKEDMYEDPLSAYSFSKSCVSQLCKVLQAQHQLPFTIARPTLAYGPGQDLSMFLPAMIQTLLDGKEFQMSFGVQTRDYVYIDDLIDALIALAANYKITRGHIFNIGSGEAIPIADLAVMVGGMLNKIELIKFGALEYRKKELMHYAVDTSKIYQMLNWQAQIDLSTGIRQTIESYQKKMVQYA
jgi:nucleoside-diphosphate-sugar epimerase